MSRRSSSRIGTGMGGMRPQRILVVGGGAVGLTAARRLERTLRGSEAEIVLLDPAPYLTYAPLLPECAAGSIDPRAVVVAHRQVLKRTRVLTGSLLALRHGERTAIVQPPQGPAHTLRYDHVVLALGSVARTLPIPGLAEVGIGCKTVEEAVWLRDHVLTRLDVASQLRDPVARQRALTFVVIGGGFAGTEVVGELQDMARAACRHYPEIDPSQMRWCIVEASPRLMPEVSDDMGRYVVERLRRRGIYVLLERRVTSLVGGEVVLDDGTVFEADTVVWTAGVRAHPVLTRTDLGLDGRGRVVVGAELRVEGAPGAWAAGDCAAVPDLSKGDGATCPPSAQHAVRQARRLADNVARAVRGRPGRPYEHASVGAVASLGLYKGVAEVFGIRMRGPLAWWLHRSYHLWALPSRTRQVRVVAGWTLALFARRDLVALARVTTPRAAFEAATTGEAGPATVHVLRPAARSRQLAG